MPDAAMRRPQGLLCSSVVSRFLAARICCPLAVFLLWVQRESRGCGK
jgi:hypothetical protein